MNFESVQKILPKTLDTIFGGAKIELEVLILKFSLFSWVYGS